MARKTNVIKRALSRPVNAVARAGAAASARIARTRAGIAENSRRRSISHLESVLNGKQTPNLSELKSGIARIIGDSETCKTLLRNETPQNKSSKHMGHLLYRAAIEVAELVAEESPERKNKASKVLLSEVESIAINEFSKPDAGRADGTPEAGYFGVPYFTRTPTISERQIFEVLQGKLESNGIKLRET